MRRRLKETIYYPYGIDLHKVMNTNNLKIRLQEHRDGQ